MPNYYTATKNPIARAGIIRKLLAKGYSLYKNYTVGDYFTKWPAATNPVVMVRFDGEFAGRPTIDLLDTEGGIPKEYIKVSPAQIDQFPSLNKNGQITRTAPARRSPVFPAAAKYSVEYMKADGSTGNYTISNPIEATSDSITAYAFGKGVRTLKKARIQSFSKVS
jgi:hypothetical protein